jgi:2-haloacid dehalogenase
VDAEHVCFVSSNAWDIAGAASFGFNAVRINRQSAPVEYEFAEMCGQLHSLSELPALLTRIAA